MSFTKPERSVSGTSGFAIKLDGDIVSVFSSGGGAGACHAEPGDRAANKGLLSLVAMHLKNTTVANFESWLTRVLRNNQVPALTAALTQVLPVVQAQ